jgi:ssDNA-binding Zn-finger/Zn-ribbon topoisomerase 1
MIYYAYLMGCILLLGSLFYFGYNFIGILLIMLWYIAAFKSKPKNLPFLNTFSSNKIKKENNKINCSKQETNICPRCGALLKERTAPFRPSWGCSNYPKCNYTKSREINI